MYEDIANHLQEWVCVDKRTALLKALDGILAHGNVNAALDIQAIMQNQQDYTTSDIIDAVYSAIERAQTEIFHAFALEVDNDFQMRDTLIHALMQLDNYEASDVILHILAADDAADDLFVRLMAFITGEHESNIDPHVLHVSDTLIDKTRAYYQHRLDNHAQAQLPPDPNWHARLAAFTDKYPNSMVSNMVVRDRVALGQPLATLIQATKLPLGTLEPHDPEQAAIEFTGLCLISEIGCRLTAPQITESLEHVYIDPIFTGQVTVKISNILSGVSNVTQ